MLLRDIHFSGFDFQVGPDGDLERVQGRESFRALVVRWLLTQPNEGPEAMTDEEMEVRRIYESEEARKAGYNAPEGERIGACLPWAPTWGAGIKKYSGRSMTPALLDELRGKLRAGLSRLQGVKRVSGLDVSSSTNGTLTIAWLLETEWDRIEDRITVRL